ncbi:MAG: hypothetical protein QG656_2268 [Candidatus Hydrogenedentes bacterium]|nr:hypothetical protein [Candidatus Hydrogenedentota bacterium]
MRRPMRYWGYLAGMALLWGASRAMYSEDAVSINPAESTGFRPQLLQVRLDAGSIPAGGSMGVTYWWQNIGDAPCDADERIFVHVCRLSASGTAPEGPLWCADHDPIIPTHRWRPGRMVSYTAYVPIPDTLQPGDYVFLAGLYLPARGTRRELDLPLPSGGSGVASENDRRYQIAKFRVLPAGTKECDGHSVQTFHPLPPSTESLTSPTPVDTTTVGNGALSLVLNAAAPKVVAWRMEKDALGGDPDDEAPEVAMFKPNDPCSYPADVRPWSIVWQIHTAETSCVYSATVKYEETTCAQFDLTFTVSGSQAEIALDHVTEFEGHALAYVRIERIVAARVGAHMAIPLTAGQLVTPAKDLAARFDYSLSWTNPVLAGIVYDRQLACALDDAGVDDHMFATVRDGWAALGVSFEHRAPAQPPVPPLLLSDRCVARLQFVRPVGKEPDWMDGARLLRPSTPIRPPDIYKQTVIYKIFCDSVETADPTTFADALGLIRRMANLTDGAPQVAYLVGWQHKGHDTGYPDVFSVNERLGGYEALLKAMSDAERYNCVLSFHDNYDDAYEESPGWDANVIARDATGGLMKGGIWGGRQSYVINPYKYARGVGMERVRRTLDMYPIRQTYHIDVLSAVPRRCDFNPQSPASGAQCLDGKIALVHEFNQRGIDITSEGFCAPFLGVIGHAWNLVRGASAPAFPGEQHIPLIPFIFSRYATWGGGQPTPEDIPNALLYNATFSTDFTRTAPQAHLTQFYYLLAAPWFLLRGKTMTNYCAQVNTRRVEYGPDTRVEVDDAGRHYRVVVDGRCISEDFTSFTPNWRGDAWLAYSQDGGTLDYLVPDGWLDPQQIKAVALTDNADGTEIPVRIEQGHIRLEAAPATPYRVSYNSPAESLH